MSHPSSSARVPGIAREAPQLSHKCGESLAPTSWVWLSTHLGGSAPTRETQHPPAAPKEGRAWRWQPEPPTGAMATGAMALVRGAPAHLRDVTAMLGSVGCTSYLPFSLSYVC